MEITERFFVRSRRIKHLKQKRVSLPTAVVCGDLFEKFFQRRPLIYFENGMKFSAMTQATLSSIMYSFFQQTTTSISQSRQLISVHV